MKDVTTDIFNRIYLVSIPDIALYSDEDIELMGLPIPDGMSIEEYTLKYRTTVGITIARMVEIYKQGYMIDLRNPEQSAEIYGLISQHLENWANVSDTTVNLPKIPINDLLVMDEMAEKLFKTNKKILVEKAVDPMSKGSDKRRRLDSLPMMNTSTEVKLEEYNRRDVISKIKARYTLEHLNDER